METLSSAVISDIKNRPLNTQLRSSSSTVNKDYLHQILFEIKRDKIKIPDKFDGRVVWQGLLPEINNQGSCGSCWAFATVDMLASRFNILSLGKVHLNFSAAKVVLCDLKGAEM